MNKQLRSILDDLYVLDPSLKSHEQELIPLVEKLLKAKPHAEPDPAFVQKLRVLLNEKSEARSTKSEMSSSLFSFLSLPKSLYAVTGVVLGVLLTAPIMYSVLQSTPSWTTSPSNENVLFSSYNISDASKRAFGEIGTSTVAQSEAYGRGGGGGGGIRPQSGGGGDGNVPVMDTMMYPPELTQYRYVFEGELPELPTDTVDVFKRNKDTLPANASRFLEMMNTGLLNLASFAGMKVDSINVYQEKEFGYTANVNFRDGSISMYANWEQWPHPESNCQTEACYQRYRVGLNDIPADDVLIGIANSFVREHGISVDTYGEPEVDNFWRAQYEATNEKSLFYIPEVARVTYPFFIDGKPVYDEGGQKTGLSINVHVRERRVNDVWGLSSQQYVRSAYPAVTDANSISAYLQKLTDMSGQYYPPETKRTIVDVVLREPTIGLVRTYTYDNVRSEELYVPSLIFPVERTQDSQFYWASTVTVPLAKELFDRLEVQPQPMPLIAE